MRRSNDESITGQEQCFSAQRYVSTLVDEGILTELTGRQRNRIFAALDVIAILTAP